MPLAFITDPRYLNISVCSNKCPVLSLIISVSFVLAHTKQGFCLFDVNLKVIALQFPLPISETCLYPWAFLSTTVRLSAYNTSYGTSFLTCSDIASITMINSRDVHQL